MIRNYFYLLRNVKELNSELKGKRIIDLYSQEKDVLFLQLENSDEEEFPALAVSASFQTPYLFIKKNQRKAKKNFAEFCYDELPTEILNFEIATNDRVVKINTSNLDFHFAIRGAQTNVFFAKENQWVRGFKKIGDEQLTKEVFAEIASLEFTESENAFFDAVKSAYGNAIIDDETERKIRKRFPQFNKEIFLQFHSRNGKTIDDLITLAREILFDNIAVILTADKKVKLLPETWQFETGAIEEKFVFENFQSALGKYIALKYKYDSFSRIYSEIEKKLLRDLEFYGDKLNNLKSRVETGSKEKIYKKIGDLLIANLHLLKKGMSKIELEDFETGEKIEVALNEKLSPNKNVDKYYEKARDEKINFEKSKELLEKTKEKYYELLELKKILTTIGDKKSLFEIRKKLKLDDAKKKNIGEKEIKYRKFLIDGKYQLFVGKDSKSNDALTVKFAKQNDLWFHARGVSGSHVVLRIENTKEAVPKSVLKSAASVAAFFSKAKTAKLAPVAYTFRKFVHKKKGSPPGQVVISRETVLIVPPEIPKNTEEIYE